MGTPKQGGDILRALPHDLGRRGNQARGNLAERGLVIAWGMTDAVREGMARIGRQPHVRRFCSTDAGRFASPARTHDWLGRCGGRFVLPLLEYADDFIPAELATADPADLDPGALRVAGSGWVSQEPGIVKATGQRHALAIRLDQDFQGQGLAVDYAVAMVAAGVALGADGGIGSRPYQSSNTDRAHALAGFVPLPEAAEPCTRLEPDGSPVTDVRQAYAYDSWMLQVPMPSISGRMPA